MILGLDVSTSVVGYTLLDEDAKLIKCEAWDLRNKRYFPDLYSKASFVKEKLEEINLYFTKQWLNYNHLTALYRGYVMTFSALVRSTYLRLAQES